MKSWVRYSVAVYLGLLFAGSLMIPRPTASARATPGNKPVDTAAVSTAETGSSGPSDPLATVPPPPAAPRRGSFVQVAPPAEH